MQLLFGTPYFIETLEGSFSSVSTPLMTRVGAFFSIFRDLQDLHSFAPLESKWEKALAKNLPEIQTARDKKKEAKRDTRNPTEKRETEKRGN